MKGRVSGASIALDKMVEPTNAQNGVNGFDDSKAYQPQEDEGTPFVSTVSLKVLDVN